MVEISNAERLASRLLFYGLVGVAIFLPWRTHLTNIFIVSSASLWFLSIRLNRFYFTKEVSFFILLLCSVYAIEVIGMVHTQNVEYGLHRLESKLALVAFPIIILAGGITSRQTERIIVAFIASTVLACVVCLFAALLKIADAGEAFTSLVTNPAYSHVGLTGPLNELHPTYLTLFICLSVFVIVDHIRTQRRNYWLLLIVAFLVFFAFQLASRAGYAALMCALILIGFAFIGLNRKKILIIYCLIICIAFVITVTLVPAVNTRLVDAFIEADVSKEQSNSVSYHFKSWICSVESWLNGNVLFGYGTGDEVITIDECYASKGWIGYRHDAHNEFLSSLVKHGLVGFIILATAFFYPFFLAFKYRDLRYFTFLTTILICFLSESMLRGQTSLVFYTLFNALFLKDVLVRNGRISSGTYDLSTT